MKVVVQIEGEEFTKEQVIQSLKEMIEVIKEEDKLPNKGDVWQYDEQGEIDGDNAIILSTSITLN